MSFPLFMPIALYFLGFIWKANRHGERDILHSLIHFLNNSLGWTKIPTQISHVVAGTLGLGQLPTACWVYVGQKQRWDEMGISMQLKSPSHSCLFCLFQNCHILYKLWTVITNFTARCFILIVSKVFSFNHLSGLYRDTLKNSWNMHIMKTFCMNFTICWWHFPQIFWSSLIYKKLIRKFRFC